MWAVAAAIVVAPSLVLAASAEAATPTLTTQASVPFPGGAMTDTANVSGGSNPTGTVTFTLYGPDNPTCAGPPVFTSTVGNGPGGPYFSGPFFPVIPGTYRWVATYSGDANNVAVGPTPCGDPTETVTLLPPPPLSLTTQAFVPFPGSGLFDTAILSGGTNPTGTITFDLFGPDNQFCTGPPIFTSTNPVFGDGPVGSNPFTPIAPGIYRWVASYSGDANNPAIGPTTCGDPLETVAFQGPAPLSLTTQASFPFPGAPMSDTATLFGGSNPTGTITFTLFGPDDATCAGPPVFTSVNPVFGGSPVGSNSFIPVIAGTYRWVATYSGDANNLPIGPTSCGDPEETRTVVPPLPLSLTTQASPPFPGGAMFDTAFLSGGSSPTGTITFTLFGPDDATCAGPPVFTSTMTVFGFGGPTASGSFIPVIPGIYRWVATYSGDANNVPVGPTLCGDPTETVFVTPPPPLSLTTLALEPFPAGELYDTATLSGGSNPTGTITFQLFGPDNATCAGPPIFTSTYPVLGDGQIGSSAYTPTAPGVYRWVAIYSGDANNPPIGPTLCGDPDETVTVVSPPPLSLTTQASTPFFGAPMFDVATLSGGSSPTGAITFTLFGPDNPACAGPPVFTSTSPVFPGPGPITSGSFTPVTPGIYRWVASYSGDANNVAVGPTACGDPNETVALVPPPAPLLTTRAIVPFPGSGLFDTAMLSGGANPTGTITFDLFGPDNPTCAGPPIFTSTNPVFGNGPIGSNAFTPTESGTYRWVASYSGDANNPAIGPTPCGVPEETVTFVAPPPPQGFLTICKAKKNGAVGNYTFTVDQRTFTVAAGQCSPSIPVPVGNVTVTEAPTIGFRLANCTTTPASRLVACHRTAGNAVVQVPAGGLSNQTVVTFTNQRASGLLKICKVAGNGVAQGSSHVFRVNGQRVVVKAGTAPGGGCALAGSFPVGTQVTIVEKVPATEEVSAIVVRPTRRLVGTPDLEGGKVMVTIDKGVTEVRFTDDLR